MSRYIEGQDRQQVTLLPECLDDFIADDNTVRIVDAFINELDLVGLGFDGAKPAATGRPSYHPSVLLKLYLYGLCSKVARPGFGHTGLSAFSGCGHSTASSTLKAAVSPIRTPQPLLSVGLAQLSGRSRAGCRR